MGSSFTQAHWFLRATSRTIKGTATASGWAVRAEFICIARIEASRESSLTTPDPVRGGAFTLVAFVSDGGGGLPLRRARPHPKFAEPATISDRGSVAAQVQLSLKIERKHLGTLGLEDRAILSENAVLKLDH